jgi:gliding motility-associated protein GldE
MESDTVPLSGDWQELILYFLLIILLLFLSALVSGSEVAFFQLKEKPAPDDKDPARNKINRLLRKPQKLLATILVANNFINISIVILSSYIATRLLTGINPTLRWLVEAVLITAIILFFGEILPKVMATRNDVGFAKKTYPLLNFLQKLFAFLIIPMMKITRAVEKYFKNESGLFTRDDLTRVFEMTRGDASSEEKKILTGILRFGDTEAKQIMKPRVDIFALPDNKTFEEIITEIREKGYSLIPVYHDNLDNITGILFAKDLLTHINRRGFHWQKLIRPAFFVPENIKLDDLLKEFQKKRTHLAIVVDEYGGTSGLITLEDVIEEVLGEEIRDEHDKEQLPYKKINARSYLFEGKTLLKDFYKYLDLDEETIAKFERAKGPSESLAGFILELNGLFPQVNDKIKFDKFEFIIKDIEKNRLEKIQVNRKK